MCSCSFILQLSQFIRGLVLGRIFFGGKIGPACPSTQLEPHIKWPWGPGLRKYIQLGGCWLLLTIRSQEDHTVAGAQVLVFCCHPRVFSFSRHWAEGQLFFIGSQVGCLMPWIHCPLPSQTSAAVINKIVACYTLLLIH